MKAKYDQIGQHYDETRKADPYLVSRLLALLQPLADGQYLDIGCGTGNYTLALWQKGLSMQGIDPSGLMLARARNRSGAIAWSLGEAAFTGLDPDSLDGVIATLTTHHWPELEAGMVEMYRILKPSGKLVIFTSTPRQMQGYWLNHYFPQMMQKSMEQMPEKQRTLHALRHAGLSAIHLEPYEVKPDLEDLFLYAGKHRPGLYLHPEVRNGISSFSDLANRAEVEKGLQQLQADIQNGQISGVMAAYPSEEGDYLFVVGEKRARKINVFFT